MQEFKQIPDYPSYQVSKDGVVINTTTNKQVKLDRGLYLKAWKDNKVRSIRMSSILFDLWGVGEIESQLQVGEQYKPLNGFPTVWITSMGRFYNTRSHKWLKVHKSRDYRYYVTVHVDGVKKTLNVARAVGVHFLPDFQEGLHVLHKDESLSYPAINCVDNLWAGTRSDNMKDMVKKGRNGGASLGKKLMS